MHTFRMALPVLSYGDDSPTGRRASRHSSQQYQQTLDQKPLQTASPVTQPVGPCPCRVAWCQAPSVRVNSGVSGTAWWRVVARRSPT